MGKQDRSLYNACSKALAICEAAARYPEEVKESERFEAAKQAAEQWDKEHGITHSDGSINLIEHIPLKQGLRHG